MRRHTLAFVLLGLLVVSAGCSSIIGGGVDEDRLKEEIEYDDLWNGSTTVTIDIEKDRYRAVYRLENTTRLELWGFRRFNNERPLSPAGLLFRHPNGSIVGPDRLSISEEGSRTVVELPAPNGSLAYASSKSGKRVRIAVPVEGSYEVILPPQGRVQYPFLGRVVPSNSDKTTSNDRVRLHWTEEELTREQIVVEYYLVRDLLLLGGLFTIAIIGGVIGLVYFLYQLRYLRSRREAVALENE